MAEKFNTGQKVCFPTDARNLRPLSGLVLTKRLFLDIALSSIPEAIR